MTWRPTLPEPIYHLDGTITLPNNPGQVIAKWAKRARGIFIVWPAHGRESDGHGFAAHPERVADRHIWKWAGLIA